MREHGFDQELQQLLPRLWRFALTLTHSRSAAEDLLQAACERALSRSQQWRPGSHFDRWAFSIMHSIWKNELRARHIRSEQQFSEADFDAELWSSDADPANKIQFRAVIQAVEQLPEKLRETLLLVYVEGYSYKEAAAILDIPIGTVMSRLASARLKLAKQFPEDAARSKRRQG